MNHLTNKIHRISNDPLPLARMRLLWINNEYVLAPKSMFWTITDIIQWYESNYGNAGGWKLLSFMDRPDKKSLNFAQQIASMEILKLDKPRVIEFI